MITAQIARDAAVMMTLTTHRPAPIVSDDPIVARMDRIVLDGAYDRDDLVLRRSRQGYVGGVQMMCQVATLAGDTLLIFWGRKDGHQRRLLVDRQGRTWTEVQGRAVVHAGKYLGVIAQIMAARAN